MNEEIENVLLKYFQAWKNQDSSLLSSIFNEDAVYKVKPFKLEEYYGLDNIKGYWEANTVAKQLNPLPIIIEKAFAKNLCFAEWENTFKTLEGKTKITRGILLLKFKDGLVQELRENYLSTEK